MDITQEIYKEIRDHCRTTGQDPCNDIYNCNCGMSFIGIVQWSSHVAEEIAKKLGEK